jgi:hypothetical protein
VKELLINYHGAYKDRFKSYQATKVLIENYEGAIKKLIRSCQGSTRELLEAIKEPKDPINEF